MTTTSRLLRALAMGAFIAAIGLTAGCASMNANTRHRQVASVLQFLYPDAKAPPAQTNDKVAVINVPFRIGVAFVPDIAAPSVRLSEADRLKLAAQVSDAFRGYPFIREIEPVPSLYLEEGGGFANLDRVAQLLRLDVIALISYDQVQHSGASGWSFLYWTGIGAYVVEGDRYDVLTAVETTVFDIRSRRLLMRAAGTSTAKGAATMVGFSEAARQARTRSFDEAVGQMIGNLHGSVKGFRERAPTDPMVKLVLPPGYNPAAGPAAAPAAK
jgi:rhombotail lipoprotein